MPHFLKLILLSRVVAQLRGPGIPFPTKSEAIAVLREFLEAGTITPVIDSTYPLSEVREAAPWQVDRRLPGSPCVITL